MSYTQKKVSWEQCVHEGVGGSIANDEYGDIIRSGEVIILARKQPHEEVITTAEGKTLLTKNIFYVDPTIEANALAIEKMDKLDGEIVYQKYVMCDLGNNPRMVRYITA